MAKEGTGDNLSPPSSSKMAGLNKPDEVAVSVTYIHTYISSSVFRHFQAYVPLNVLARPVACACVTGALVVKKRLIPPVIV